MGRWYLLVIIVGVMVGAMLPSDSGSGPPPASRAADESSPDESRPAIVRPGSGFNAAAATSPTALPGQEITLDRAGDGHFYADAEVNGTTVRFMVDTGASGVALSATDAERVGLLFHSGEFTAVGHGASGEVRGKVVTLDRVTLGDKAVQNVSGAILEGSQMSLLGQSFLGQMGTIEISGNRMIIR